MESSIECTTLEGHWSSVQWVAELKGKHAGLVCSASADKTTRIWLRPNKINIEFHPELILRGHSLAVSCVVQLLDDRLCTGSQDGLIKIWDHEKDWTVGQCDKTLRGHSKGVNIVMQMRDPTRLCSGSNDHSLRIWDLNSYQCLYSLCEHSAGVLNVIELSNGKLCSTSADHSLVMWSKRNNAGNGSEQQAGSSSAAASIRRPSDLFAAQRNTRTTRSHALSQSKEPAAAVDTSVLSSSEAAAGQGEDEKFVFENALITRGHKGPVTGVVELPDGYLCSSSVDKTLKLWDPASYVCIKTLEGHWAAVNCVFLLQGGLLCSGSDDHKIKLWDLTRFSKKNISTPDDHCVRTLEGHTGAVRKVIQLGDGSLCSCGDDNTVKIWRFR